MKLTVSITLSEQDAQNANNAFECRIIDTRSDNLIGGFTWQGMADSPTEIIFCESGDFVNDLVEVDVGIISDDPFDYTLDVEVI